MSRSTRPTILVSGMVAGVPGQGGATWAVLQYVLGLRALGYEVVLVEPIADGDAQEHVTPAVATYFDAVSRRFGLDGSAALVGPDRRTRGMEYGAVVEAAGRAAALINLSGMLRDAEIADRVPVRLYLDLDPAFTQLWHAVDGLDMGFAGHTHFATVGLSIGRATCQVPTCGREWIPTLQPVLLDEWDADGAPPRRDAFTTVANWRGYGSIEHDGRLYGQKVHAFRELIDLPARSGERFEVALAIHRDETRDLEALSRGGWRLLDPRRVAGAPGSYRRFVRRSAAELGVAKTGYVASRCGWFSDRSVCYLASGRPVLAHDTGFTEHLPHGEGLLAFDSPETAIEGVAEIRGDYARHARAAREIAESRFRSDVVLHALLDAVGLAA